jgi:hypothetical protein
LFQKRIYSIFGGTLVGKRKQTIFKKRWFDITTTYVGCSYKKTMMLTLCLRYPGLKTPMVGGIDLVGRVLETKSIIPAQVGTVPRRMPLFLLCHLKT